MSAIGATYILMFFWYGGCDTQVLWKKYIATNSFYMLLKAVNCNNYIVFWNKNQENYWQMYKKHCIILIVTRRSQTSHLI